MSLPIKTLLHMPVLKADVSSWKAVPCTKQTTLFKHIALNIQQTKTGIGVFRLGIIPVKHHPTSRKLHTSLFPFWFPVSASKTTGPEPQETQAMSVSQNGSPILVSKETPEWRPSHLTGANFVETSPLSHFLSGLAKEKHQTCVYH